MAVTMALSWIFLVLTVTGTSASGEFSVLHSPDSVKFTGTGETLENLLLDIFSAALGLSVEENSHWKGLHIVDPFNTPEAIVEVYVDGVPSLREYGWHRARTYPLSVEDYEPDTFERIKHRIKKQRQTNEHNNFVYIRLSDGNKLDFDMPKKARSSTTPETHRLLYLKPDIDEDNQFLTELETLNGIINQVNSGAIIPDNVTDFYSFSFRSIHTLSDFHGPNSDKTEEAKQLLCNALLDLSKAFTAAYRGSVLVAVITSDVAHSRRRARSVNYLRDKEPDFIDRSSEDYAAIFNILLFFGISLCFSLLAVVHCMLDMDPGRDSIIYRMTSIKMKKEN